MLARQFKFALAATGFVGFTLIVMQGNLQKSATAIAVAAAALIIGYIAAAIRDRN